MRMTREPVTGYAHCPMQVDEHGELAFDFDGTPMGIDRCKGYAQVKVAAIKETAAWTYGDLGAGSSGDPMDQALAHNVSHTHERLVWADLEDRPCPHCGSDRDVTDQIRPVYAPLGGPRGNADQLFADRRERREQGRAMATSASAAERQAAALEQANALKERELDMREAELEAHAPIPATHRRKPAPRVPAEVE